MENNMAQLEMGTCVGCRCCGCQGIGHCSHTGSHWFCWKWKDTKARMGEVKK